ncbi:unnamed protein product [Staurois parvus]|uniref:Uncharacterized protein n=1 Tax=Staurois parvus TaxID=386267 RepID=A0ABN9B1V2_9NEOB|nr:unnamed protein product [Staurois parvus]
MGPPTDLRPSGSARVSKWSVRPCPPLLRSVIVWRMSRHHISL